MEKVEYLGSDGTHDFSLIIREDTNFIWSGSSNTTYETRTESHARTISSTNSGSTPRIVYDTHEYTIPHQTSSTSICVDDEVFHLSSTYNIADDTLARRIILKDNDKEILLKVIMINPNIDLKEKINPDTYFRTNYGGGIICTKTSTTIYNGKNAEGEPTFSIICKTNKSNVFFIIASIILGYLIFFGPFFSKVIFSSIASSSKIEKISLFFKKLLDSYSTLNYFKFASIPIAILLLVIYIVDKREQKRNFVSKEERENHLQEFNSTYGAILNKANELYREYSKI